MEHYLIAGCGFVGTELARILEGAGHRVTGLTGGDESAEALRKSVSFSVRACDLGDQSAVRQLGEELKGVSGVVHCASSGRGGEESYRRVYLGGMQNLAAAFPGAPLLFTSSTSVYPQTDGVVVEENSGADPDRPTGKLLRAAEEVALEGGGTVARLAGIYGPGRWFLLKKFLEGTASVEVREDAMDGRFINSIHRDDAASALAFLLENRRGGIFNVTDDLSLSQRAAYAVLAEYYGKPMPPDAAPDLNRKRGWTNKQVANGKLRAAGWKPRFGSIKEALGEIDPKGL